MSNWFVEKRPTIRKWIKFVLAIYFINIFFATWGPGYRLESFFGMTSHGGRDDIIAMFLLIAILGFTEKVSSETFIDGKSLPTSSGSYLLLISIKAIFLATIFSYLNIMFPFRGNILTYHAPLYLFRQLVTHAINGLLLFGIASILSNSFWVGFLTGLLFVIHPIHPEAIHYAGVGYIGISYALFFIVSLFLYVLSNRIAKKILYLMSLPFFIVSLYLSPLAASLPLVIILADRQLYHLKGENYLFVKRFKEYLPFILILGLYFIFLKGIGDYEILGFEEILKRVLFVPFTTLILPLNRIVLKEWSLGRGLAVLAVLTPFALAALNNRMVKSRTFILGLLLVVSFNLPVFYKVELHNAMLLSRTFYLSSIGYCFSLAYVLVNLDYSFGKMSKVKVRGIIIAIILFGYMFTTYNNNYRWLKSSEIVQLQNDLLSS